MHTVGLFKQAKFGVHRSRGVGTGAPKISDIGHFCVVMCGYISQAAW